MNAFQNTIIAILKYISKMHRELIAHSFGDIFGDILRGQIRDFPAYLWCKQCPRLGQLLSIHYVSPGNF
jgi:hypothetical protein